jgi:hypothetical protein
LSTPNDDVSGSTGGHEADRTAAPAAVTGHAAVTAPAPAPVVAVVVPQKLKPGMTPEKLAHLRRIGQQPGAPGRNPLGGGAKPRLFSEALYEELSLTIPDDHAVVQRMPHLKGKTWAHAVAVGQILAAVKGKADAAQLVADRTEGRLPMPLTGPDGADLFRAGDSLPEAIVSMLERVGIMASLPSARPRAVKP